MAVDYIDGLPSGIDFYNQNWANNRDLNKIDAFKGLDSSLVAVNDGTGHFMFLPIDYVNQQKSRAGVSQGTSRSRGAGFLGNLFGGGHSSHYSTSSGNSGSAPAPSGPQGAYLNTTDGAAPGGFADYLAQIGLDPALANQPQQSGGLIGSIMAGFGSGPGPWWMRALRGGHGGNVFASIGGMPGNNSNLYNSFLQYVAAHPAAPAAPVPAQTQPVGYQF